LVEFADATDAHRAMVRCSPRMPTPTGYLHGYSEPERERLHRQARFLEPMVHDRLPFRRRRRLLEVGSGVGAQTEILLRHFPELHVTGIEIMGDRPLHDHEG
jgi:hypothetical protein